MFNNYPAVKTMWLLLMAAFPGRDGKDTWTPGPGLILSATPGGINTTSPNITVKKGRYNGNIDI
jgi:hypothetical protein